METQTAKLVRRLQSEGWSFLRHGANHDVFTHPDRALPIQVPRHRHVSPGVARSIAKAAGWI
jgi:predicted RNA binding protein YcfA (HicA-like mRNA interferase family)